MGKEKKNKTKIVVHKLKNPNSDGVYFYASESHAENMSCIIACTKSKIDIKSGEMYVASASNTNDTGATIAVPTLPVIIIRSNNNNSNIIFGVTNVLNYCFMKDENKIEYNSNTNCVQISDSLDVMSCLMKNALSAKTISSNSSNSGQEKEGFIKFSKLTPHTRPLQADQSTDSLNTITSSLILMNKMASNPKQSQIVTSMMPIIINYLVDIEVGSYSDLNDILKIANQFLTTEGIDASIAKRTKAISPQILITRDIPSPSPAVITDDFNTSGLQHCLQGIFSCAISHAFPELSSILDSQTPSGGMTSKEEFLTAIVTRCGNISHGDFQCNSAMKFSKFFREIVKAVEVVSTYPMTPAVVAEHIVAALPSNALIDSTSIVPNGFINIKLKKSTLINSISATLKHGVRPPQTNPKRIAVDFSSPNIAKEMHVGHLRSTIIGDSVCRVLEFCGHDVVRINHVGDWGTQFGMLITYLQEKYKDTETEMDASSISITDLTVIYKAAKKRFDDDESFKEMSRNNVVKLQAGDADCRKIWNMLCDISRLEFQKVYNALNVRIDECGESFYNPLIPGAIEELTNKGLIKEDEGMLIIMLAHFTIPLILRKSDGGYGYDSTDMAALRYRIFDLKADWIIYITDAGQANHFYMCFDAAKEAEWTAASASTPAEAIRLDHIGFGVVCGDDGKRFKTRSGTTIKLIDLLNESKKRMESSIRERVAEKKTMLMEEEIIDSAAKIGYGAVKYADLKSHPTTDYIFNFDRMLDTKGDTAVYLMFAYARISSILRKANDERNINISEYFDKSEDIITLEFPAERALAFKTMQFGDMIRSVTRDLLPNRVCDFLKELSVDFTSFVTTCHVLNSDEAISRLLLCESVRRVMKQCFFMLGIEPLEKI